MWAVLPSALNRSIINTAAAAVIMTIKFVKFSTARACFSTSVASRVIFDHLSATNFFAGGASGDKFLNSITAEFLAGGAACPLFDHLSATNFFAGKATSDKFCDYPAAELFADGTTIRFVTHFTAAQFFTVLAEPRFLSGQDIAV